MELQLFLASTSYLNLWSSSLPLALGFYLWGFWWFHLCDWDRIPANWPFIVDWQQWSLVHYCSSWVYRLVLGSCCCRSWYHWSVTLSKQSTRVWVCGFRFIVQRFLVSFEEKGVVWRRDWDWGWVMLIWCQGGFGVFWFMLTWLGDWLRISRWVLGICLFLLSFRCLFSW